VNPFDFIAPRRCVFCGVLSSGGEKAICVGCFDDLPWRTPAGFSSSRLLLSEAAALDYSFPIDSAIKALKFNRKLFYIPAFAEILATTVTVLPDDVDAVLPVPLHWRRRVLRGFNQAAELAKPLAALLDLPLQCGVVRNKVTGFQSGLNATERARNLRHAFAVRTKLSARHILIVDDVTTTGATINSLAAALYRGGVDQVSALTLARAELSN
jgi:ComF family protein